MKLEPIIDLGKQPISNAFLAKEEFKDEYFYDLVLGYDKETHAIGLVNNVPREKMFHENYAFLSSTSESMKQHFKETAEKLKKYVGDGVVIEIGSNDGIMLEAWKELGVHAIGVEPAANVRKLSRNQGHTVLPGFMDDDMADEISSFQDVSLVYGANVSCHVEDIESYFKNIRTLIGNKGVFVFEDPYFLDIVDKVAYDQIYDEHAWYFTIKFINAMFEPHGYHVFNCEHIDVHGGELRMYVGHKDTYTKQLIVTHWEAQEGSLSSKLLKFKKDIEESRTRLRLKLESLDGTICGFGATSKSTTILNYCDIGPDLLTFITDVTPTKIEKYSPGMHIPIIDESKLMGVDNALMLAWNHEEWIRENVPFNGEWIMPHS